MNIIQQSDYSNISATGWTQQYSYSAGPDQTWSSADYTNIPPAVSTNVRWVRWTKALVIAGERGSFFFKVIIR